MARSLQYRLRVLMATKRWLLWCATAILVILVCAAASLYWASRSEAMLRWGIDRMATRLPCALSIEGVQGAIAKPVQIQRVICENDRYRIEAHQVSVVWAPWLLTKGQLEVSDLRADHILFLAKPGDSSPSHAPVNLGLPIEVAVTAINIGALDITTGGDSIQFRDLSASYRGGMQSHRLTLHHVDSDWGQLQGETTLNASAPLQVVARATGSSGYVEGWPISAEIEVSGELQRMMVAVRGVAGTVPFAGEIVMAPFESDPIASLVMNVSRVGISSFDARLPHTALSAKLAARVRGLEALSGTLRIDNAEPGKFDQQRLPMQALTTDFSLDANSLRLSALQLDLGPAGKASGSAQIAPDRTVLSLDVSKLNLKAAHGSLRSTQLQGSVRVENRTDLRLVSMNLHENDMHLEGEAEVTTQRVNVKRLLARIGTAQMRATGSIGVDDELAYTLDGTLTDFDPARFGEFPEARINGTLNAQGKLRPDWHAEVQYKLGRSRFRGKSLDGSGKFRVSKSRLRDANLQLNLGENKLNLTGSFGAPGDTVNFKLNARQLSDLDKRTSGRLQASGILSGSVSRLAITTELRGESIGFEQYQVGSVSARLSIAQGDDPKLHGDASFKRFARGELVLDSFDINAHGTLASHAIEIHANAPHVNLASHFNGGWNTAQRRWTGAIESFENRGEYTINMLRPTTLEITQDVVLVGATDVRFQQTELSLSETAIRGGEIVSQGDVKGVRAARLFGLMKKPPAIESTLVVDGHWKIRASESVDGFVEVTRVSGDIVIPGEEPLALGLQELRLTLRAEANQLTAEAIVRSAQVNGRGVARTLLERRGVKWGVPGTAPLKLEGQLAMQSLRPLAALASRSVTADGNFTVKVNGDGTIEKPRLTGNVEGDKLKFEHVANGVFFREGSLRAHFVDDVVTVDAFNIKGGNGSLSANGQFAARADTPLIELDWKADKLDAVQHPYLRLKVSGAGKLVYRDSRFALRGALSADQGRVELRSTTAPTLGDDVYVAGRETRSELVTKTKRADLDVTLDLGPDFTITGRGIDARLAGQIRLTSSADQALAAHGEIRVASGTYFAYEKQLQIETGVLQFSGPIDNPAINILALRKKQPVEAGVEVTGTARDPRVRLASNPEVPDPEKLSWLVLGRKVESSNSADTQALQASAIALAAGLGTAPLQKQLARTVGLDEITLTTGNSTEQSGVVVVGKQISDKVYVTHEHGLSSASNTLRVTYQLSRRWSVRSESGTADAVDLFFTISFD